MAVPLIPREVLFGNPERLSPQISPDGRRLAYLAPDDGVLNVWVRTVGRSDDRPVTRDRGRGVRYFFWARNNRQILYIQDRGGDENWHVYAVRVVDDADAGADDGGNSGAGGGDGDTVDLTPVDGVKADIIAVDRQFPDTILIGLNDRVPQLHDVYRVDLRTGRRTLEVRNDVGAVGWMADRHLRVRLALVPTADGGFSVLHRAGPDDAWSPLLQWGQEDAMTTSPYAFAVDDATLYLAASAGSNTASLRAFNVHTREERVLAADPEADVSDVLIHPETREVQAVAFTKARTEWILLDESIRGDFEALERLHRGEFEIINRDTADRTWLVAYTQDTGPVVYYAYDRMARRGTRLFSSRPELERAPLAEMRPVSYVARDGLTIHGYLTLPPGVEPTALPLRPPWRLPAVLNVHGGPWHRDEWGYDPEAQWLANRGYACLQVNYRGSTGYGKAFVNAGDKEWGGRMQDDLTDAVRWLVEQGIADPGRIGIYGGSYGGFAVLSGLTMTPDLFACGVDVVGPSNLITFINTIPPYWEPLKVTFANRVGDVDSEQEFLKSRSPLFHIDRITAPLLIAQGANDPRVKQEESVQMVEALKAAGKIVEYLEFSDEGHGFARPENRLTFYAAAEKFLAEHLGGRYER